LARKTRFRQQRIYRLKIIIVLIISITMLFSGLMVVDLNKCYTIYGEHRLDLLQIEQLNADSYTVYILDKSYTLNLKFIKKDINHAKEFFSSLMK
jgi:hypothetical protein